MEETKDERTKRLARERQARFKLAHPEYNTEASRKFRERTPSYQWPAKKQNTEKVRTHKEGTPCTDCGMTFPYECMDFDHRVSSEKTNNVGTMVAHGWSWELIEAEIAKCDLVCANCHRTRTRKRRQK